MRVTYKKEKQKMSEEVKKEYHIGEYACGGNRKRREMEVVVFRKKDMQQWSDDLRWAIRWAEGMSFMFGFTLAMLILNLYGVI